MMSQATANSAIFELSSGHILLYLPIFCWTEEFGRHVGCGQAPNVFVCPAAGCRLDFYCAEPIVCTCQQIGSGIHKNFARQSALLRA